MADYGWLYGCKWAPHIKIYSFGMGWFWGLGVTSSHGCVTSSDFRSHGVLKCQVPNGKKRMFSKHVYLVDVNGPEGKCPRWCQEIEFQVATCWVKGIQKQDNIWIVAGMEWLTWENKHGNGHPTCFFLVSLHPQELGRWPSHTIPMLTTPDPERHRFWQRPLSPEKNTRLAKLRQRILLHSNIAKKRGSKIHGVPIGWQKSVKSIASHSSTKIPVNRANKHIRTQAPPIHPKDGIEWPHQTSSNMPLPDIYPDPAPDSPWLRRLSLVAGQNRLQTSSDVGSAHHGCLDVGWFWTPINGYIYIIYIDKSPP